MSEIDNLARLLNRRGVPERAIFDVGRLGSIPPSSELIRLRENDGTWFVEYVDMGRPRVIAEGPTVAAVADPFVDAAIDLARQHRYNVLDPPIDLKGDLVTELQKFPPVPEIRFTGWQGSDSFAQPGRQLQLSQIAAVTNDPGIATRGFRTHGMYAVLAAGFDMSLLLERPEDRPTYLLPGITLKVQGVQHVEGVDVVLVEEVDRRGRPKHPRRSKRMGDGPIQRYIVDARERQSTWPDDTYVETLLQAGSVT